MSATLRISLATLCVCAAAACDGGTDGPGPLPPPVALVFTSEAASVASMQSLGTVAVTFTDAHGHLASNVVREVTIALANGGDSAHVSGQTTATSVAGVATFTDLHVDKAGSAYRLVATAPDVQSAMSAPFGVSVGPAAAILLSTPASTEAGHTVPPVTADVVDAGGNLVTTATQPISLLVASQDTATLSGTTTRSAVAGRATFDDLSMVRAFGHLLIATAPALVPDTVNVVITPGPAALLVFGSQLATGRVGATLPGVSVYITDQYGNPGYPYRNWGGIPVTVALENNPTGATLGGTTTASTFRGFVSFSVSLDRSGMGYTLKASAPNLPSVVSAPFDIAP